MRNKCTLLVDGNWLLQSRFPMIGRGFEKDTPDVAKEQSMKELKELMARSINVVLNRFPVIDNIVMISDGGSWRKQLPVPKSLKDITYKGNRTQAKEIDWNYIYKALNQLTKRCKEIGITTVSHPMIEGDDWIWYWSRRLNAEGTNCIIWSSDNDLKQLTQINHETNSFTVWYNDRNGLFMPEEINKPIDLFDFFLHPEYNSPVLETLKRTCKQSDFINPCDIVMSKVICGDSGDNIKSVFRYEKNGRVYRISEKEWETIKEDMDIKNLNDFINHVEDIVNVIVNHKKYKSYNPSYDDIKEMIEYNIKLVWLHESVIPETITMYMNQIDYKNYDLNYIRSNFKVMLDDNDDVIKNIFEGL